MSGPPVRIGTRGSALALVQARLVANALAAEGRPGRIVVVETEGDRRAADTAWGEGAFVAAIERALLERRVDVAVHSAKDVPTLEEPRLRIVAYLRRDDPLDALVVREGAEGTSLEMLPAGSTVGTDSPRRSAFLRARRPDLIVRPLHGNVDTRLRRLDAGEVDALVLATAGLARLGRKDRIAQRIPATVIPPAPGQGAVAVQVRAGDAPLLAIGAAIDDRITRLHVEAERAFLRASGGGCRAPIGALASSGNGSLRLLGGFAVEGGRQALVEAIEGPMTSSQELAERLAERLTARLGAQAAGAGS